jgi:transcription elongation factor Elf1
MTDTNTCPRCGSELNSTLVLNALSRVDNKTYICSPCGAAEALYNFGHPDKPLPSLSEKISG